jgi:hypothetical protein
MYHNTTMQINLYYLGGITKVGIIALNYIQHIVKDRCHSILCLLIQPGTKDCILTRGCYQTNQQDLDTLASNDYFLHSVVQHRCLYETF